MEELVLFLHISFPRSEYSPIVGEQKSQDCDRLSSVNLSRTPGADSVSEGEYEL